MTTSTSNLALASRLRTLRRVSAAKRCSERVNLMPACHDDVVKGEKAAVVERLESILRLVCAFGFVGKSHTFLFWLQHEHYKTR